MGFVRCCPYRLSRAKRRRSCTQRRRFRNMPIARPHVHDAIVVTHEIVRTNGAPDHAPYQLLTDDFFEITFAEVLDTTRASP